MKYTARKWLFFLGLFFTFGCSSWNIPKELIERNWAFNITAGGKPALGASWQSSIATQDDPCADPEPTVPGTTTDEPTSQDSDGDNPTSVVLFDELKARMVAGALPTPTPIVPGTKDSEGKHLGEEQAVPLTGWIPPRCNDTVACQIQGEGGFLWKPIAGGTGRPVVYLPAACNGQVSDVSIADGAMQAVDAGIPMRAVGDQDRPFYDARKTRDEYPRQCWVVVTFKDASVARYPIFDAMLRNGAGHGSSPPYLYPVVATVPVPDHPTSSYRGIMPTDWALTKDLIAVYGDHMQRWRAVGINAVYVVGDLAIPPDQHGRTHIGRGRTRSAPEPLLVQNLCLIQAAGFKTILAAGNEPTVRSGYGHRLGISGASETADGDRLTEADLYTSDRLMAEQTFWTDLLTGPAASCVDAIVLYLEPSHATAVPFQRELARYLRDALGFQGRLYANGYGAGAWYTGEYNVRDARSVNWSAWQAGDRGALVNCDGMFELTEQTAAEIVPAVVAAPGPDGWILWADGYRGKGGPSAFPGWLASRI